MTISMFDAYLERSALVRSERMMDMGQATIYAQLTTEGRRKMWNGWNNVVNQINTMMLMKDSAVQNKNPIIWNGQKVGIKGLIRKFAETWGKGSVR